MPIELLYRFQFDKVLQTKTVSASELNMLGEAIRERMMGMAERCRLLEEIGWTLMLANDKIVARKESCDDIVEAYEEAEICGINRSDIIVCKDE